MVHRRHFLKSSLALMGIPMVDPWVLGQKEESNRQENPYGLSPEKAQWMKEATLQQLLGCRVKGHDGTWIHTPDGIGNYKALWTRDFYYMVEYAGDLIDLFIPSNVFVSKVCVLVIHLYIVNQ